MAFERSLARLSHAYSACTPKWGCSHSRRSGNGVYALLLPLLLLLTLSLPVTAADTNGVDSTAAVPSAGMVERAQGSNADALNAFFGAASAEDTAADGAAAAATTTAATATAATDTATDSAPATVPESAAEGKATGDAVTATSNTTANTAEAYEAGTNAEEHASSEVIATPEVRITHDAASALSTFRSAASTSDRDYAATFDLSALNQPAQPIATDSKLPFHLHMEQQGKELKINFTIDGKSYIYRDSIKVQALDSSLYLGALTLPPSVEHQDALGTSQVYFNEVQITVPISVGEAGDHVQLTYQGCDENGICYPPQTVRLVLETAVDSSATGTTAHHSMASAAEATGSTDSSTTTSSNNTNSRRHFTALPATDSQGGDDDLDAGDDDWGDFELITKESQYSNKLTQIIADNIFIGVLLSFLLGIGLDLTPCVLPMLPIFSAMIIGSQKEKAKSKDELSLTANELNSQPSYTRYFKRWTVIIVQNIGYALGLSLTYMVLGLLMSMLGAGLHSVLQSPPVLIFLAILLLICALACAGVVELRLPALITNRLQKQLSIIKTTSFSGAFMFGAISALIVSPCTSAPLAGALLYVMQTGNFWIGAPLFFAIGLGMATPLLIVGIFGAKFLQNSGIVGDIIKRIMVVVLVISAYYLVQHLLGRLELFITMLMIYVVLIYIVISIYTLIRRQSMNLMATTIVAVLALIPTYFSTDVFETRQERVPYEAFTPIQTEQALEQSLKGQYSYVMFTAKWCTNCKFMERTIYSQEAFLRSSKDINRVVVDITDTRNEETTRLMEKYQIIGVPFYMTIAPDGTIVHSQLGLCDETQVLHSLNELKAMQASDPSFAAKPRVAIRPPITASLQERVSAP